MLGMVSNVLYWTGDHNGIFVYLIWLKTKNLVKSRILKNYRFRLPWLAIRLLNDVVRVRVHLLIRLIRVQWCAAGAAWTNIEAPYPRPVDVFRFCPIGLPTAPTDTPRPVHEIRYVRHDTRINRILNFLIIDTTISSWFVSCEWQWHEH